MSQVKVYRGDGIAVQFNPARCIHSAECVRGLPAVFDPKARPWIRPDQAGAAEVAEVVSRCPTGALQARRDDGRPAEAPAARNELRLVADGPHHLRGAIEIRDADGKTLAQETRLALCRCGASNHKPYCDNSHVASSFSHDGSCPAGETAALQAGPLTLTLTADGPVQCDGPLAIVDAFGETAAATNQTWLCRCGKSKNKPFCDGSHKAAGFRS